jgi:hypothetical protein
MVNQALDGTRITDETFSRLEFAVEGGTILGCTAAEIRTGVEQYLTRRRIYARSEDFSAMLAGASGFGKFPPGPMDVEDDYRALALAAALMAGDVLSKVLEGDASTLITFQKTTFSFQGTCRDAIADIIRDLEGTVADIIERFPRSTKESWALYWAAVRLAADACFATVAKLLDEHVQSPGYRGDKSWETMEEAVVAKAKAGDPPAQAYVEEHEHLPEHPGKPLWNGTEWIDFPADFWREPRSRYEEMVQDRLSEQALYDEDAVCCILNAWPVGGQPPQEAQHLADQSQSQINHQGKATT